MSAVRRDEIRKVLDWHGKTGEPARCSGHHIEDIFGFPATMYGHCVHGWDDIVSEIDEALP